MDKDTFPFVAFRRRHGRLRIQQLIEAVPWRTSDLRRVIRSDAEVTIAAGPWKEAPFMTLQRTGVPLL